MKRCNQCKQELIELDNRGERLAGCLSCNLWSASAKSSGSGFQRRTCMPSTICDTAERRRRCSSLAAECKWAPAEASAG